MERYSRIRALGKGNMGQAHLVRHNTTGVTYVMKLVDMSKMNRRERQFALNEAKLLASVRHPNVVEYHDSFTTRGGSQLCIVMEYCDGGDLFASVQARRGRPFSEQQIVDWFLQILLGMRSIAKAKLLHRDIKTANIFLTKGGVIKIGDFGVGRSLDHTFDVARTFVGTPYYLSPEIAAERPYSFASDMWSVGVVLYELLALRWPFQSNDMRGLMARIARAQFDPIPTNAPAHLRETVRRLLVVDPRRRPTPDTLLKESIFSQRLQQYSTLASGRSPVLSRDYVHSLAKVGDIDSPPDPDYAPAAGHEAPRARQRGASLPTSPAREQNGLPPVGGDPRPRGVSPGGRGNSPGARGGAVDPIARLAEIRAQFAAMGARPNAHLPPVGGGGGLGAAPAPPQPRQRARSQPISPARRAADPAGYWAGRGAPLAPRNGNYGGAGGAGGVGAGKGAAPGVPKHLLPGVRPSSRDAENRAPNVGAVRRVSPHARRPSPPGRGALGRGLMGGGPFGPPPGRLAAIR